MKNYYEILGLQQTATNEEIKTAYRKLSTKFHPDKNDGDNYFSEWTKKINEAYETLGNISKREAYDKLLINNKSSQETKHSTNSSYNEYQILSQIQNLTTEFLEAKYALAQSQYRYNQIARQIVINKFSVTRIMLIILLFLISAYGLKKNFANQTVKENENYTPSEVTAISGLSIREKPNRHALELAVAPYKSKLKVLDDKVSTDYIKGKNGYWYKVDFNGTTGYAWGNYIVSQ